MTLNTDGSVLEQTEYTPYGSELNKQGDDQNNRGYINREYDSELGLSYLNAMKSDLHSDVTFVVEGQRIHSHKVILEFHFIFLFFI